MIQWSGFTNSNQPMRTTMWKYWKNYIKNLSPLGSLSRSSSVRGLIRSVLTSMELISSEFTIQSTSSALTVRMSLILQSSEHFRLFLLWSVILLSQWVPFKIKKATTLLELYYAPLTSIWLSFLTITLKFQVGLMNLTLFCSQSPKIWVDL